MIRLTAQASRFVLNPFYPKPIRPKLFQFVVRNLDYGDMFDGVELIHNKANSSQINSSNLRPV